MIIDTLRPDGIDAAGGWTAQPSGTLDGVTSDDNDTTYAQSTTFTTLRLTVPAHSPPADHQRHAIRGRIRARSGSSVATVRYGPTRPGGGFPGPNTANLTVTPTDFTGSWVNDGFFSLGNGSSIVYAALGNQPSLADNVRLLEMYVDVDNRHKPTFTPALLDGAGVDQAGGTVTDSNIVRTRFDDDDYDGLNPREWRVAIYTLAQTMDVGFAPFVTTPISEASASGAPQVASHVLPNDDYVAYYQLFSNIRQLDPFSSDIETAAFTVDAIGALAPANMTVTPVVDPPSFDICWDAPADAGLWTEPGNVYVEIVRRDCNGTQQVALIEGALEGCYTDRFAPLANQGRFCDAADHECEVCYDVRYWGYRGVTVEPVESPIPEGVILAWPDSDASIPSNWTRVAALDGRYPKGVPDGSTNPGATGGVATHGHTMAGSHNHAVNHSHGQGNTGNASETTPTTGGSRLTPSTIHSHTRPTTSTATVNSQNATPTVNSEDNEAPRKEVVFVESDGIDTTVPAGMLAIQHASTPAPGWQLEDSDGAGVSTRPPYWKGATGDGSLTFVLEPAHNHGFNAHTHNGTTHGHTSADTGQGGGTLGVVDATSPPVAAIPRNTHRHEIDINNASTGALSGGAGITGDGAGTLTEDLLFRATSFIESVTGDQFVGLIGMWLGTLANIPIGWRLCDGTTGTPNFLGRYPRHKGALSVNLTGGGSSHNHPGGIHSHTIGSHNHGASVVSPGSPAWVAPNFGGVTRSLGGHTHSASNTNNATPTVGDRNTGATSTAGTEPEHTEVAYIMLTAGNVEPSDIQLLVASEIATFCVDAQPNPQPGCDWLRGYLEGDLCVCADRTYEKVRPFGRFQPIAGGLPTVTTGTPGGRDYTLQWAVTSEADVELAEAILAQPLNHYTPVGQRPLFMAPDPTSIEVVKIKRLRTVSATFVEVDPPPFPAPADVIPEPSP